MPGDQLRTITTQHPRCPLSLQTLLPRFIITVVLTVSLHHNSWALSVPRNHKRPRTGTIVTATAKRRRNNKNRYYTSPSDLSSRSVEKSLHERGYQYIIGSDEVGRGAIAGPVLAASCCILTSVDDYEYSLAQLADGSGSGGVPYHPIEQVVGDSKQLTESQRRSVYQQILEQPNVYAWTMSQRSPKQIEQQNIVRATMECFRDSIWDLVDRYNLPTPTIIGQEISMKQISSGNNYSNINNDNHQHQHPCGTYSIVDGPTAPKLKCAKHPNAKLPCRPYVRGDEKVYTVALASILAKVTRDELMDRAHEMYPQYGFDTNRGYATRRHVEAIHAHGPCEFHRPSFRPLKGRFVGASS